MTAKAGSTAGAGEIFGGRVKSVQGDVLPQGSLHGREEIPRTALAKSWHTEGATARDSELISLHGCSCWGILF